MTWMECFEKYGYYSLLNYETDDIEPEMEFFLENGEIPNQLREIYLSKYRDELFLILQPDRDENVKNSAKDGTTILWHLLILEVFRMTIEKV